MGGGVEVAVAGEDVSVLAGVAVASTVEMTATLLAVSAASGAGEPSPWLSAEQPSSAASDTSTTATRTISLFDRTVALNAIRKLRIEREVRCLVATTFCGTCAALSRGPA